MTGMKHMPAGAFSSAPMMSSRWGENLPAGCLRPERGQPRHVVSVNDDVMELDRHAASMRGPPVRVAAWSRRAAQCDVDQLGQPERSAASEVRDRLERRFGVEVGRSVAAEQGGEDLGD